MNAPRTSRRSFLRGAGLGAAALLGASINLDARGAHWAALPVVAQSAFMPDVEIDITARQKTAQILSGAATTVWAYEGQVLSGSGVTVETLPGSYLGPILRGQSGKKIRINFRNQLNEASVVHPHGLTVPSDIDGLPTQAIGTGQTKVYDFQLIDSARPAWFHPHPHMRTGPQVLMGLAGLFYVTDSAEQAVVPGAATGAHDIPLVIQDRSFDSNNQFTYNADMMAGFLGNRILVNGKAGASFAVEPRAYRLRVLNGSNARTYKLAWSNNMPLKVIATDGGLLPAVASRNYVMLMPGERVDLWVDFASYPNRQLILRSLSFNAGSGGMGGMGMGGMGMGMDGMGMGMDHMGGGGGGMGGGGLANGAAFDICAFTVGAKASVRPALGPLPPLSVKFDASNVPNFNTPVPFTLAMQHMMTWTINGRVYEETAVASDEYVQFNVPVAWEWYNNSSLPHPMHIHGVQFQVVKRTPPSGSSAYGTVKDGFVDTGWKDTVSVWPGERVKVAMRFGSFLGMYMYHCHNLEHEDMGMMRNLMVVA